MSDKTITCGELELRLADYLDGTIGDAERVAIEAHLATCGNCAAIVRALDERPAAAVAPSASTHGRMSPGLPGRSQPRAPASRASAGAASSRSSPSCSSRAPSPPIRTRGR